MCGTESSGPPTDAARRARRALLMLTRCNQAVLRATGEDSLYQAVCKLIVEVGGYRMCWIGVGEEDERRSVRPVASHGSGQDYLSTVGIVWADAEGGRGPTGTALRTGKPVLGRDFNQDPEHWLWRAEALERGFQSCSALPLLFEGERLGVMTMYAPEPHAFDEEEVEFLQQLADDVAHGIHVLRVRAERERAERALESRGRDLHTILQTALDGFVVVDEDRRLLDVNEAYLAMSGYSRDELLRLRVEDLEAVGEAEEIAARLRLLLRGEAQRFETRHRRKDGTVFEVEAAARRFGSGGRVACFFRDLTAHKRLEEQLRQAQKLESVARLAGGVAHDFNNVLTVILACADSLRESFAEGWDSFAADVDEIRAAGQRARDLTRQLQVFARIQPVLPVRLDVNALLEESEKLLRRLLGEDIALRIVPDPELWPVFCDPGQLSQVMVHLALNARDAMPEGGPLTLETRNVLRPPPAGAADGGGPEEFVRLSVSDRGHGLGPDERAHLFEPFFTTKPPGQGAGLGLATVYGVVRQCGGHVEVESEPGRGTTFLVYLPRDRHQAVDDRPAPSRARGSAGRILVVDDEPPIRRVVARSLRTAGYSVLEAADAREGLAVAAPENGELHLLVTDVGLPGPSGCRLAEELLRLHPGLRVLYVSGYTGDALDRRGIHEGAQFLAKPFTLTTLLARVREVLERP